MENKILILLLITLTIITFLTVSISSLTEILRPDGAGTYTQWYFNTSYTFMADNSNMTIIQMNGTNYVGRNQTYNVTDHTSKAGDRITNVTVFSVSRETAVSVTIAHKIRGVNNNATFNNTAAFQPNTAFSVIGTSWLNNSLYSNNPWNVSNINALEIGVGFITTSNAARRVNVSEMWVEVTYFTDFPTWVNPAKNVTSVKQNDLVMFNTTWRDNTTSLAGYIFGINQTGAWVNSSYISFTNTYNISTNATTITAVAGTNVTWNFWANDTEGNSNQTDIQSFVVAAGDTCNYGGTGNWILNCTDNCTFASTQTLSGGNNITITGTGNLNFSSGGHWNFTGTGQYITIASGCKLNIATGGGWNS